MGHVDHGKTSLLDAIRSTNVVSGESGGITQHIGAYQVAVGGGLITFIDTPGHAAFTQMRARGASVTDIVVLVVAADDGVMPQTVEAINHAKAAGVPIMVAINKIDLPDADPQRSKQALLEHELVAEEFGGEVICVEVSATRGTNLDTLLESLALQAEILELTARDTGKAVGTVIEAELDKGRGPVATFLIREGTLEKGDMVVAGTVWGRVRAMVDDQGGQVNAAGPSMPVQVIGLGSVPDAGDEFIVVKNERETKQLVDHRLAAEKRSAVVESGLPMSAEELFKDLDESDEKELTIVIKADVRGTLEAVQETVAKLSTERVTTNVIQSGVGGITESDVMLASASSALVLGFRVRPDAAARRAGEGEGVHIRCFEVIHELLDDVTELMSGLLPPKVTEVVTGHAEVRELFVIPRVGTVAGSAVPEGVIRRSNLIRVVRNGLPIYSGRLASLRHFKDDVREVLAGRECGIRIENFNDVKVGDILESYLLEETPDTL
jgi:translation initiation factor IF-2